MSDQEQGGDGDRRRIGEASDALLRGEHAGNDQHYHDSERRDIDRNKLGEKKDQGHDHDDQGDDGIWIHVFRVLWFLQRGKNPPYRDVASENPFSISATSL